MADLDTLIEQEARANGLDPKMLRAFVQIESGGRPDARTGKYSGLLQLSNSEFKKYGGTGDITDPAQNLKIGAKKLAAESVRFQTRFGRKPEANDLYMVHQQGEGGYSAHTANPGAPAWQNMASTAEGRQKGPGWSKAAIWGNVPKDERAKFGGDVNNVTSADFMDMWKGKVDRFSSATPAKAMATRLRAKFAPQTEGGVTKAAPSQTGGTRAHGSVDRAKAPATYDPSMIEAWQNLTKAGQKIAGNAQGWQGALGGTLVSGLGGFLEGRETEKKKATDDATIAAVLADGNVPPALRALLDNPAYRDEAIAMVVKSQQPKPESWKADGNGSLVNEANGEIRAIPGFQKQVAPTDAEKRAIAGGLKPGTPEFNAYVLQGPEKAAGASLPAEVGARIGLGDNFQSELPGLKERIAKFDPVDYANLALGKGEAAEVWRRADSGRDALVRHLTGAGVGVAEATNQAARYQISPLDRPETMLRKLDGLSKDLDAVRGGAIGGKSGALSKTPGIGAAGLPAPASAEPAPQVTASDALTQAKAALAAGASKEAVMQRLQKMGIDPSGL